MRVCVFGSSSAKTKSSFVKEAERLGKILAERGHFCVNGGGKFGVMGGLNAGCVEAKGRVLGVVHERFCVDGGESKAIDMVVAPGSCLFERKQLLFDNADCFLVLAGGPGTYDEFWEVVLHKRLGMKGLVGKPVCVVNQDGFYDGTVAQMERASEGGMLYESVEAHFHVEKDIVSALDWLEKAFAEESQKQKQKNSKGKETRMLEREGSVGALAARVGKALCAPEFLVGLSLGVTAGVCWNSLRAVAS